MWIVAFINKLCHTIVYMYTHSLIIRTHTRTEHLKPSTFRNPFRKVKLVLVDSYPVL